MAPKAAVKRLYDNAGGIANILSLSEVPPDICRAPARVLGIDLTFNLGDLHHSHHI